MTRQKNTPDPEPHTPLYRCVGVGAGTAQVRDTPLSKCSSRRRWWNLHRETHRYRCVQTDTVFPNPGVTVGLSTPPTSSGSEWTGTFEPVRTSTGAESVESRRYGVPGTNTSHHPRGSAPRTDTPLYRCVSVHPVWGRNSVRKTVESSPATEMGGSGAERTRSANSGSYRRKKVDSEWCQQSQLCPNCLPVGSEHIEHFDRGGWGSSTSTSVLERTRRERKAA